jgi:SNF2 family DNA or RNA helicase
MLSLNRLRARKNDDTIQVPYESSQREYVLFELQKIFLKFNISEKPSPNVTGILKNYYTDQNNFAGFSNRARLIRNDEFKNSPELLEEFRYFTEVIEDRLERRLYPLQLLSAYHLAFSQNACNFAVPGAGKTSIVYAAYAYLKECPDLAKRVEKILVIGPKSSFAPWENEYEACFGTKPNSIRIDAGLSYDDRKNHFYSQDSPELTLIYFDSASRLEEQITDFLKKYRVMVVVDEAHRIKAKDGAWSSSIINLANNAASRVILTGTPIPNGYQDLYNLIRFIWPRRYKEILGFHYGNLQQMSAAAELKSPRVKQLTENVSPFFIRIKKDDLNLPPAIENPTLIIKMGERQRGIYEAIEAKYVASFEANSGANLKNLLNKAKMIRLRQAATNPALLNKPLEEYYHDLGISDDLGIDDTEFIQQIQSYSLSETPTKFVAVLGLLKKLLANESEKAIVWSIFVQNAKDLKKFLENSGIETELLIGEVGQDKREEVIGKFNNPTNSEFRVVIANPAAVGESISIHKGCHNAIYLEKDYNAASLVQSKDRIHRVGLEPSVVTNYFYILSENTIDEIIHNRLTDKIDRMTKFINSEIPLFVNNLDFEEDETDLVKAILREYARKTNKV